MATRSPDPGAGAGLHRDASEAAGASYFVCDFAFGTIGFDERCARSNSSRQVMPPSANAYSVGRVCASHPPKFIHH